MRSPTTRSLDIHVVDAARALAALGLVDAFGHVSARDVDHMVITPAADLATVATSDCLRVPLTATALPSGCPAEAWAHLALYRRYPATGAIARAQPAASLAVGMRTDRVAPTHGQACWLGDSIPVYPSALLVRDADRGRSLAEAMGSADAMILRGNGAIAMGSDPATAVATMSVLAAACTVWLQTRGEPAAPLSAEEIRSWQAVKPELLPRLGAHLLRKTAAVGPAR
ncbi:class II aldolase/adducin family protein [Nocardia sp. NPDC046763]|uniref:class II aldolase/adducin family protein n=1 Tax=Nocardia sp. NPDC046763 TaxID=3155256 RepID=UPI0033D2E131